MFAQIRGATALPLCDKYGAIVVTRKYEILAMDRKSLWTCSDNNDAKQISWRPSVSDRKAIQDRNTIQPKDRYRCQPQSQQCVAAW